MSNQEPQNQEETTKEEVVEKRRRFIKGASFAPVVLTLSSPSVFRIQCGSEIASGGSQTSVEGSCESGKSPEFWGKPANKDSWPEVYKYGVLKNNKDDPNKWENYEKGTTFKAAFGIGTGGETLLKELHGGNKGNDKQLLNDTQLLKAYLSAALLNAAKSKSYPLTVEGVKAIQEKKSGSLPTKPGQIPDDTDVINYLKTTW